MKYYDMLFLRNEKLKVKKKSMINDSDYKKILKMYTYLLD